MSQNVRVKLPDDEELDDMSDINMSDELAEEEIERIKIKHKNEAMRKEKKKIMIIIKIIHQMMTRKVIKKIKKIKITKKRLKLA